jgi:hypothetical protein
MNFFDIELPWLKRRKNIFTHHSISRLDIEMLCNYYANLFPEMFLSLEHHILTNTKEFIEHCLDQNHIEWNDKSYMLHYISKIRKYIHRHIEVKIGLTKTLTQQEENEMDDIILTIFERNR